MQRVKSNKKKTHIVATYLNDKQMKMFNKVIKDKDITASKVLRDLLLQFIKEN